MRHTVSVAIVGRIQHELGTSENFAGRPDRLEVEAALERIAHRMVVQREWDREEMRVPAPG